MNSVCIFGRLTRDPELRYSKAGKAFANISIATTDRAKHGDDWVDDPAFVDITVFGTTAENVSKYRKKGQPLTIQGRLRTESWDDKHGQKRSKLAVMAQTVKWEFIKEDGQQRAAAPAAPQGAPQQEDDVPF